MTNFTLKRFTAEQSSPLTSLRCFIEIRQLHPVQEIFLAEQRQVVRVTNESSIEGNSLISLAKMMSAIKTWDREQLIDCPRVDQEHSLPCNNAQPHNSP